MTNPKWEIGPVKLANGGDAQIFLFDEFRKVYLGAYRLLGGGLYALEWREDGSPIDGTKGFHLDPPPKKKVRVRRWAVIYSDGSASFSFTKDEATKHAKKHGFALLEIDIEVEEGEGL